MNRRRLRGDQKMGVRPCEGTGRPGHGRAGLVSADGLRGVYAHRGQVEGVLIRAIGLAAYFSACLFALSLRDLSALAAATLAGC